LSTSLARGWLAYFLVSRIGLVSRAIEVVTLLPSTIPHIVMGVAFLVAFSQAPINLYGTAFLLFLAYTAIFLPQAFQSARSCFTQISPTLSEAARVFGATEARSLVAILLPLVVPGLLAGALIVMVLALAETNASIILSGTSVPVVGPTLFNAPQRSPQPSSARAGGLLK
jgi:iron(III) transport system permease protein